MSFEGVDSCHKMVEMEMVETLSRNGGNGKCGNGNGGNGTGGKGNGLEIEIVGTGVQNHFWTSI